MKRHTPSPATAGRISSRSLRVAAALVLPLGLLSACSVSLSSPQSQESPGEAAQATPSVSVSVGTDGVSVNDGSTSVSVGADGVSVTDGGNGGSGSGSSGNGGSGGSAPANPGTASDCSWLDDEISPHHAVNVGSDTYMVTQQNETIRIANDLRTLTVSGGNADVVVMNVDNVIINGTNADVYVCNVGSVTINSGVHNASVVWSPGVTPVVQDFGINSETHAHDHDS